MSFLYDKISKVKSKNVYYRNNYKKNLKTLLKTKLSIIIIDGNALSGYYYDKKRIQFNKVNIIDFASIILCKKENGKKKIQCR